MRSFLLLLGVFVIAARSFAQVSTVPSIDLENYPYFAPVSYLDLTIQNEPMKMGYMDVRPENPNGRCVLLFHGKNFSGNYWKRTANELSKQGYRVIIPDQIGFGKSSKPQHIQYSFQLLAVNTKKLLDTLGITHAAIVGHSMGGMLAIRFALMYPQTVEKLALVCPLGLEDYKTEAPYQTIEVRYKTELSQNTEKLKKYMKDNYFHGTWKQEYEQLLEIPSGWFNNKDYTKIAWNSALTYDMIFTQPVVYELPNLKMPIVLIVGILDHTAIGKDLATEDQKQTMGDFKKLGKVARSANPNIRLKELNTGHLPQFEDFDTYFSTLSTFLAK